MLYLQERLSRLDLRGCDKVQVFTMWGQSTGAALRAALPSLAQLHKPGTTELVLHNTRMDEDLAQGIADAAAAGWQVSLTKVRWSDDALARPLPPLRTVALANGGRPSKELMRSLSTVAELSVQEMCFVSRWVPEGCVVPWRNTRISRWEAILHEFVNEATALDGQTSWDLQSMLLQLSPEGVRKACMYVCDAAAAYADPCIVCIHCGTVLLHRSHPETTSAWPRPYAELTSPV